MENNQLNILTDTFIAHFIRCWDIESHIIVFKLREAQLHPSNVLYLYQWREYSQSILFVRRVIEEIYGRHTIINYIDYTNTNQSITIVVFHMIASHHFGNCSFNFWRLLMFGCWIPRWNIVCFLFIRNLWLLFLKCKSL